MVVAGSLGDGLEVRLDPGVSIEEMAVGRYVVIDGRMRRFFGMVTDVKLGASNPQLALSPPRHLRPLCRRGHRRHEHLRRAEGNADVDDGTRRTGQSGLASAGEDGAKSLLARGRRQRADVADVSARKTRATSTSAGPWTWRRRSVSTSSALSPAAAAFSASRAPARLSSRVCFWRASFTATLPSTWSSTCTTSTVGRAARRKAMSPRACASCSGSRVAIFTLDENSSRDRGVSADEVVEIAYEEVEPEDVALLREALGMTEAQVESVYRLARRFGEKRWLAEFLAITDPDARDELARETGLNPSTLTVLHRKMDTRLARLPFLKPKGNANSMRKIMDYLKSGKSVVLEFGRHNGLDAYILVANILTRRIHEEYVEAVDRAQGNKAALPPHLMITIEEAHKFLSPEVADHTIFGTIAREMRKYNVTLLVVDQRPSGIADEVMSQIGTRVTCLLDDEKDIAAVLSGVSGAQALKGVLARLDSRQQALILGHAVPMPVVIRTRDYGNTPESYAEFGFVEAVALHEQAAKDVDDLFPE